MDIKTFHKYNRLVKRGLARPLTCPQCGEVYTLRVTEDNEPVLQCLMCNSKTFPGKNTWDNVKAIVQEHMPTGEDYGPV